ncbi:RNA-binding protein 41-like [Scleropages formosus]|uniref:RNA-binding protein 41-like n=1 Tax=Scleropages formosus TaxID=113540 RepID=A0A0P7WBY7_SCLFO|nr:RNA-binding protein 41-like [Scleropages formosus]
MQVARHSYEDGPVPEEQETEGQRQLHSLLLQQLDTDTDIDRKCFAPAALYKPFGEQAAGVRSLSQFQALQDGEQELASLRELGLTDAEIELWRNRDDPEAGEKARHSRIRGMRVAPDARDERLQVIRDKMAARSELLSRPQRLSASRPLSRREMEIERALFHGSERPNFLSALYHQEEESHSSQDGLSSSNPLDSLYREVLEQKEQRVSSVKAGAGSQEVVSQPLPKSECKETLRPSDIDQSQTMRDSDLSSLKNGDSDQEQSAKALESSGQSQSQGSCNGSQHGGPKSLNANQPIGSLCATARQRPDGPMTVSGPIAEILEEEIQANRATEEEIRSIPRFQSYHKGDLSQVLCIKNLSPKTTLAQLVSLFSRFQRPTAPPVLYRLLTGRLKGQAFVTFPDVDTARAALELLNGYRLLGRPLVIEFGREKKEGTPTPEPPYSSGHSAETKGLKS